MSMGCDCKHDPMSTDMMVARGGLPWTGPQLANIDEPRSRRRRKRQKVARPVVLRLLSRRELIFDARSKQSESVPLPSFDTSAYGKWVLSVAVAVKTGYLPSNVLKVWIQNVVVDPDNPAVVFAGAGPSVAITASPAAPHLLTSDSSAAVGAQARLLLEWSQGGDVFNPPASPVAVTVLSVWLTLKPKSTPPAL